MSTARTRIKAKHERDNAPENQVCSGPIWALIDRIGSSILLILRRRQARVTHSCRPRPIMNVIFGTAGKICIYKHESLSSG